MSDTVIKVVRGLNRLTSTLESLARRLAINKKRKVTKKKPGASSKKKAGTRR